jgi:hypothetical protein
MPAGHGFPTLVYGVDSAVKKQPLQIRIRYWLRSKGSSQLRVTYVIIAWEARGQVNWGSHVSLLPSVRRLVVMFICLLLRIY